MTAGWGTWWMLRHLRRRHQITRNGGMGLGILAIIGLLVLVTQFIDLDSNAVRLPVATGHALSAHWSEFQIDCVAGPVPGQGASPQGCRCWEAHLEAADIYPTYASDVLRAATAGEGDAYTVSENIGNVSIRDALNGCGIYH